jgi:hypothetical protein
MVAIVVVAVLALSGGNPVTTASSTEEATAAVPAGPSAPDPTSAAQQYLHAFAAGDTDTAGVLTDDPHAYFMRKLFTIGALAAAAALLPAVPAVAATPHAPALGPFCFTHTPPPSLVGFSVVGAYTETSGAFVTTC